MKHSTNARPDAESVDSDTLASSRGTLRTCETHPAVLRRALLLTRPRSDSGTVFIRALASALFTGAARGRLAHAVIRPANYVPSDGARSPSLLSVPVLAGFRTITCRALCPARQALQTLLADRPRHAPAAPASSIRRPADGAPSVPWPWLRRRRRAPRDRFVVLERARALAERFVQRRDQRRARDQPRQTFAQHRVAGERRKLGMKLARETDPRRKIMALEGAAFTSDRRADRSSGAAMP